VFREPGARPAAVREARFSSDDLMLVAALAGGVAATINRLLGAWFSARP